MSRENAISVEAIKVGINQTKDGYFIRLALHPNDDITSLVTSPVGTRYLMAFVEVDQHNEPVTRVGSRIVAAPATGTPFDKYVTQAAMLCNESRFQEWLVSQGHATEVSADAAKEALYRILNITSRTELRIPERGDARNGWDVLYKNFIGSIDL
jgi:hypothetical protein